MARILFTWEAGLNKSHLSNMAMIARPLVEQGHVVAVAARELQHTHDFFAGMSIQFYQAPFKQGEPPQLQNYLSYAHVLYAAGYADARELTVLLSAWLGILYSFAPDIILCDHSPTALLASRAINAKRFVIGSGFLVPTKEPVLGLFPHTSTDPEVIKKIQDDEAILCQTINQAVSPYDIEPVETLSDLYVRVDGELILSYPEIDSFGERDCDDYYGVWPIRTGNAPQWPTVWQRNIFAYLSDFPGCEVLLSELATLEANVLVYPTGISDELIKRYGNNQLRFIDDLLDLEQVANDCDLFISHGAHTSVVRMLLKGVPQFMIPNYNEQLFTANRVAELGAGLIVDRNQTSFIDSIRAMLDSDQYKAKANEFSERHARENSDVRLLRMLDRINASLN